MTTTSVPTEMLSQLLESTALHEARTTYELDAKLRTEPSPPDVLHPGDAFGRVLMFAWSLGESQAVRLMSAYMEGLRNAAEAAGVAPPKLAAVLAGLTYAVPDHVMAPEVLQNEVVPTLRVTTPEYFGDPSL